MINVVLFDLDGVIRHFVPDRVAAIEARYGVAPGLIHSSAFSPPLLKQVTTGRISRSQWIEVVGRHIDNSPAADEWGRQAPRPDYGVLALIDDVRRRGYMVGVLTNGTDTISEEMQELDLEGHFDVVFNSATIGYAKPDARAFNHVLEKLHSAPHEVFFIDDSVDNVAGAVQMGMTAHHYRGINELSSALLAAGIKHGAD